MLFDPHLYSYACLVSIFIIVPGLGGGVPLERPSPQGKTRVLTGTRFIWNEAALKPPLFPASSFSNKLKFLIPVTRKLFIPFS